MACVLSSHACAVRNSPRRVEGALGRGPVVAPWLAAGAATAAVSSVTVACHAIGGAGAAWPLCVALE